MLHRGPKTRQKKDKQAAQSRSFLDQSQARKAYRGRKVLYVRLQRCVHPENWPKKEPAIGDRPLRQGPVHRLSSGTHLIK